MRKIILASASPRRRELLATLGLQFEVTPANVTETTDTTDTPQELAKALSRQKAQAVARHNKNALIIAADTFILFRGKIMGKPDSDAAAYRMLQALSGKSHTVITGYTIIDTASGKTISRAIETRVYLKALTPAEIANYVKSGEPRDKAGGYAIQGRGAAIVKKISGDYSNVVGLPLSALVEDLKAFDIYVL